MNPSDLKSLAKIGLVTFCGAFFSVLATTKVPTSLDEVKGYVLPALIAAITAEIVFLAAQSNALKTLLTSATSLPAITPALSPTAAAQPAALLARAALPQGPQGSSVPTKDAANATGSGGPTT